MALTESRQGAELVLFIHAFDPADDEASESSPRESGRSQARPPSMIRFRLLPPLEVHCISVKTNGRLV